MKNKSILIIVFLICSIIAVAQKYGQQEFPYGRQQRQPSSWQGTGWAINNGYVVTNHHVVDGARTLVLKRMNGDQVMEYIGEVAVMDEEHDLAIIRITNTDFVGFGRLPYKLRAEQAEVGESVFVLGYPMVQHLGDEIKLTTGVLSSRSGYQNDPCSYQVTAPIQAGNSGGPLFDEDGNVIGCVNANVPSAENVGYAIKGKHIQELISRLPDAGMVKPVHGDLIGKKLSEQVKALKPFVFYIYASTQASELTRPSSPSKTGPSGQGAGAESYQRRIIELPYVDASRAMGYLRINKVIVEEKETIVEFRYSNRSSNGSYQWVNIAVETYIEIDNRQYKMRRAEGIAVAPNRTSFDGIKDDMVFRLIFPALPQGATSFNLVEPGDSDWKFYGISLKK